MVAEPVNIHRLTPHPAGMAPRIGNFAQWAVHIVDALTSSTGRAAGRAVRVPDGAPRPGRAAAITQPPGDLQLITIISTFAATAPRSVEIPRCAGLAPVSVPHVLPKVDLHLHQEVSARLDRVLARRAGRAPHDWASWRARAMAEVAPGMDRLASMSAVRTVSKHLDAGDDELFVARVVDLLTEAAAHGAVFAEVRFGNETVLRQGFLDLFRSAERAVAARFPALRAEPVVTLVTAMAPDRLAAVVRRCVELAADGLAGIDLQYRPYDTEADWRPLYAMADRFAAAGLGLTAHAGEFSPANIAAAARTPGLTRIGHGIHAANDQALLDLLVRNGITLEVCLTSNVVLGAVPSIAEHPLRKLVDAGVPVALGTDNPVRTATDLSTEYATAAELGCDAAELTRTGIRAAFTTPERRTALLATIDP